jgi:hypothetical protein
LLADPERWPVIKGTGGARKGRVADPSDSRGKSGSFRYIVWLRLVGVTQYSLIISRIMLAEEIMNTSRRVIRTQSLAFMFYWRVMIVERVGQNVEKVARYLSLAFMFYWRGMIVERVGENIEKVARYLKSYSNLKPERRDTLNEYYHSIKDQHLIS